MMAARAYWGSIGPMPAAQLAAVAKMQEDMGLAGTFAAQVYGPPWAPLAAASVSTSRLLLASGIALAFVRSPFETAMAAMDLDRMSGGRFVLGLGPSVRAWSEGFFGMPYGKPVEHLRETITAVRHVIAGSHTGRMTDFEGKYHQLRFRDFQPLAPPLRPEIPVWVAATRGRLVRLAGEMCEGLLGHPIWSVEWARERVATDLKAGLDRAGRKRADVHVNLWFFVAPGEDVAQCLEDARGTVAFYGGIEQYESYFAAHGFGKEAKALQAAIHTGSYLEAARLVPDEMARTFVAAGTPDEVRKRIEAAWEVADSLTLVPPALSAGPRAGEYAATIAQLFYG
jgi:probable F420-dependent oxidoreductase